MLKRGLVLSVGSNGSGKSTTLASMNDYRNAHDSGHILCIEEPLEFLHEHKKSVVDHREIGIDTMSYTEALKTRMREVPGVITIRELRNRETMPHSIAYADWSPLPFHPARE